MFLIWKSSLFVLKSSQGVAKTIREKCPQLNKNYFSGMMKYLGIFLIAFVNHQCGYVHCITSLSGLPLLPAAAESTSNFFCRLPHVCIHKSVTRLRVMGHDGQASMRHASGLQKYLSDCQSGSESVLAHTFPMSELGGSVFQNIVTLQNCQSVKQSHFTERTARKRL